MMKPLTFAVLAAALLGAGCATKSTVETRKQERPGVYSNLSPELRQLVDQGRIKVAMPMEAVYIAWGKPSQIVQSETSEGASTTWVYQGTYWETHRYWTYRYHPYGSYRYYPAPHLEHDYIPRSFIRAEVVFQDGVVKRWHTLPAPRGY